MVVLVPVWFIISCSGIHRGITFTCSYSAQIFFLLHSFLTRIFCLFTFYLFIYYVFKTKFCALAEALKYVPYFCLHQAFNIVSLAYHEKQNLFFLLFLLTAEIWRIHSDFAVLEVQCVTTVDELHVFLYSVVLSLCCRLLCLVNC